MLRHGAVRNYTVSEAQGTQNRDCGRLRQVGRHWWSGSTSCRAGAFREESMTWRCLWRAKARTYTLPGLGSQGLWERWPGDGLHSGGGCRRSSVGRQPGPLERVARCVCREGTELIWAFAIEELAFWGGGLYPAWRFSRWLRAGSLVLPVSVIR